jgi:hypothetical protein
MDDEATTLYAARHLTSWSLRPPCGVARGSGSHNPDWTKPLRGSFESC